MQVLGSLASCCGLCGMRLRLSQSGHGICELYQVGHQYTDLACEVTCCGSGHGEQARGCA